MASPDRARLAAPPAERMAPVVLEFVYTSILVLAFLLIGWFSFYVVYKLYQGQR